MSIQDKVVLITGATGGLGPTVIRQAADAGAYLALTARRLEALHELARELALPAERILLHPADLSVPAEVQALVDAVIARWGGIDVLLNIAGGWMGGKRLGDLPIEDWDAAMHMNLRSAFLINRAVLPSMQERGWGRIINMGSRSAVDPGTRQAQYNVSKAGVVALTQSVANDYRRKGITANVILPSIIDTPDNRRQTPDADFSRWVKPEDLAELMLYLCTDAAGSITGAAIPVYGGM